MYERKQNGEVFFSSLCVTYSRFGNCSANGLVTEQPQYSVVVCIFHILQNTEIQLISNDLRLIFTSTLFLAVPITFHVARHTFATTITLQREIPLETVSKMLGHTKITTTQIYARVVDTKVMRDMAALKRMYASKTEESPNKAVNE